VNCEQTRWQFTLSVSPTPRNMTEKDSPAPRLVRDLMSVGVPTCPLDTSLVELTRLLLEKGWEGAVVLDEQGHGAGVVTQDELVQAYAAGEYEGLTAESIMRADVPQIPPDIPLAAAAQLMQDLNVRVVYMMHHAGGIEYPAAFLTYNHLLRHMAMENPEDLDDLGIKAQRESPIETFIRRRDEARRRATGR
jgi:CBS domain-containing protein